MLAIKLNLKCVLIGWCRIYASVNTEKMTWTSCVAPRLDSVFWMKNFSGDTWDRKALRGCREVFLEADLLLSELPEALKLSSSPCQVRRSSAGIMGTDGAAEPQGSTGDLAVLLRRPLTVRRDQDHRQLYPLHFLIWQMALPNKLLKHTHMLSISPQINVSVIPKIICLFFSTHANTITALITAVGA